MCIVYRIVFIERNNQSQYRMEVNEFVPLSAIYLLTLYGVNRL